MDDPSKAAKGKDKERPLSGSEGHMRRGSAASIESTTDASSHVSSKHDRYRSRSPDFSALDRTRSDGTAQSGRYGHSRTQSMISDSTRSQTRRREKAAVGFACLNCKKAHLACDGKFLPRSTHRRQETQRFQNPSMLCLVYDLRSCSTSKRSDLVTRQIRVL